MLDREVLRGVPPNPPRSVHVIKLKCGARRSPRFVEASDSYGLRCAASPQLSNEPYPCTAREHDRDRERRHGRKTDEHTGAYFALQPPLVPSCREPAWVTPVNPDLDVVAHAISAEVANEVDYVEGAVRPLDPNRDLVRITPAARVRLNGGNRGARFESRIPDAALPGRCLAKPSIGERDGEQTEQNSRDGPNESTFQPTRRRVSARRRCLVRDLGVRGIVDLNSLPYWWSRVEALADCRSVEVVKRRTSERRLGRRRRASGPGKRRLQHQRPTDHGIHTRPAACGRALDEAWLQSSCRLA
jgi:hypothetical protein